MTTGRCLCGSIKIEFHGAPKMAALCHCGTCKYYTGSAYSHNIVVSYDEFSVTGTPKEVRLTADSGKSITNCYCGDCGTTLYRYGDAFGGLGGDRIIQGGVLDGSEDLDAYKPDLEMFIENRTAWVPSLELDGVKQFRGMPSG
ncbi:Mss4-like protein [Xylariaceae sp. FL1651]|nr:Mss4-like protein [Xylariaceae sp. FL1651]